MFKKKKLFYIALISLLFLFVGQVFALDVTAPTITLTSNYLGATTDLTFECSDSESGCKGIFYSINDGAYTEYNEYENTSETITSGSSFIKGISTYAWNTFWTQSFTNNDFYTKNYTTSISVYELMDVCSSYDGDFRFKFNYSDLSSSYSNTVSVNGKVFYPSFTGSDMNKVLTSVELQFYNRCASTNTARIINITVNGQKNKSLVNFTTNVPSITRNNTVNYYATDTKGNTSVVNKTFFGLTGWLPNGEAPLFVQWDGNVVSNDVFTVLDQADLNRVKLAGFNGVSVDVRANFIWDSCTGVPATDFDWDAIDDLVAWANDNNLYLNFQPVYDGTGYIPSCIDSNASYLRATYDYNFPNQTGYKFAAANETNDQISIWDNDLNNVLTYWLTNFASRYANEPSVVLFTAPPNEGFANGLIDNNMSIDANLYWQTVYLPSQYANIGALNSDWGTSYAGFTSVPIPRTRTNIKASNHFWTAKSNRAIEWYKRIVYLLKSNAPNVLVTTQKLLPDYFYPNGAGYRAYTHGVDVNKLMAELTLAGVDFLSLDPYPDQATPLNQAIVLDTRYGLAKSIADLYNKPVFIGEYFPTVNGGDSETCDEQLFVQGLTQAMAYKGDNIYSGIVGVSVFSWKWSGKGGDEVVSACLSIRDSNSESIIRNLAPYLKTIMKEKNLDYNSNFYFYDNTNLNLMNTRQYMSYEQLHGWINQTHRYKDYPSQFLINGQVPSNYTDVVYANPFYDYNANVANYYNWVNGGGKLFSGYRVWDENESTFNEFGSETNNERTPLADIIFGNSYNNPQGVFNNLTLQDYNIHSTKTILSGANGTIIFSCKVGSTCDIESTAMTTGTIEAKWSLGTTARISRNILGAGDTVHFHFNLYDLIYDNGQTTNTDVMFNDLLDWAGLTKRDSSLSNIYGWNANEMAVFNAVGSSTYTYEFDLNTPYTALLIDGNIITTFDTTSPEFAIALTSGQSVLLLKGEDLTPPTTNSIITRYGSTNDFNLSFTCTDDYYGCDKLYYSIDGGAYTEIDFNANNKYDFNYTITNNTHTITYYSTDNQNNQETIKTTIFPIAYGIIDEFNSRISFYGVGVYNGYTVTDWEWIIDGVTYNTSSSFDYYPSTQNLDYNVCLNISNNYQNNSYCFNQAGWDSTDPTVDANLVFNTGFVSNFDINYSFSCIDNTSPLNYKITKSDGNTFYDTNDVNATMVTGSITLASAESTNLTFTCTDSWGNTSSYTSEDIYAITFRLINESNGNALTTADFNGSKSPFFIKKITAYTIDGNYSYDFNATSTVENNMLMYSNAVRFEIIYNNAGTDLYISKEIDFSVLPESNIGVCIAPLQTFYEQRLTSVSQRRGYIYLPTAKCYALAGTLHYLSESGYFNNTHTIDRPYELYSYLNGVRTYLVLINGGIANTHNLDALAFNQQGVTIQVGKDTVVFKPLLNTVTGVYDTNIMQIFYHSFYGTNTSLKMDIYLEDILIYSFTESSEFDDVVLNWNWTAFNITDQNILKLIVTTTVDGETVENTFYFTIGGEYYDQENNPALMAVIAIMFFIFGITLTSVGRTFGWIGLFVCVGSLFITLMSPSYYWISMIQAGLMICFLYILLSGKSAQSIGGGVR